jgi:hypothetical protein
MNRSFEQYNIKQKTDFSISVITLIASLIIIILINLLIINIYQIDEKKLLNELSELFIERSRFGLWPEPIERAQYLLTIALVPFIIFLIYNLLIKLIKQITDARLSIIYYFSFILSALLIFLLIYFDLKLNPDNFIAIENKPFYRDTRNFIASLITWQSVCITLLSTLFFIYLIQYDIGGRFLNILKIIIYTIIFALIIDIFLIVQGKNLLLKVTNALVTSITDIHTKSGFGIENAKTQLSLLYPNKHSLTLEEANHCFIVTLKLNIS